MFQKDEQTISVNVEIANLRHMIDLIRKFKYEIIELKKQGITKRNINRIVKFLAKKENRIY